MAQTIQLIRAEGYFISHTLVETVKTMKTIELHSKLKEKEKRPLSKATSPRCGGDNLHRRIVSGWYASG